MGRARRTKEALHQSTSTIHDGGRYSGDLAGIRDDITHEEVGSQAHKARMVDYGIGRLAFASPPRTNLTVRFDNYCDVCNHRLEAHLEPNNDRSEPCRGKSKSGRCGCSEYHPGGGSHTDMKGNITVQSDIPPDGDGRDRQICIWGLMRHELCHELYTDRQVWENFLRDQQHRAENEDDPFYKKRKDIFNIIEDGRIETIESALEPASYRYIHGLNLLHPRVPRPGSTEVQARDGEYIVPRGYTALDADGNELSSIRDAVHPLTGEEISMLHVPAGTRLDPWGPRPVSLTHQMERALLASSVPGFEPGNLHPDVRAALDECMPHIQAGIRGPETAEEMARKHGASTQEAHDRAQEIYEILKKHNLLPIPEEEKGGGGGTRPTKDDEIGDKPSGTKKGDGEDGEKEDDEGGGDGEDEDDDESDDEGDSEGGAGGGGASYDAEGELPETSDQDILDDLRDEVEQDMEADRAREEAEAEDRRSDRDLNSEDIKTGDRVFSQSQLEEDIFSNNDGRQALEDEQTELRSLGEDLASELRLLQASNQRMVSGELRGRIDPRRLSAGMAGSPYIRQARLLPREDSIEVSLVIDRSGSVGGDSEDQYRMAVMCGHAAEITGVPMGIYGYSNDDRDVHQYTYKEPDSSSLTGLGAIFKTGDGGTPTGEAVAFHRDKLQARGARQKIMVIVTDGDPNNREDTVRQVEEARAAGIQVVGVGFRFPGGDSPSMNKIFGEGGWVNVNQYSEVPEMVSTLILGAVGK